MEVVLQEVESLPLEIVVREVEEPTEPSDYGNLLLVAGGLAILGIALTIAMMGKKR